MPITAADFHLTSFMTCSSDTQQYINRWYWRADSASGTAEDLLAAFKADLIPPLMLMLSLTMTFSTAEAYNLVDDTDFGVILGGEGGGRPGDPLSSMIAMGFTLHRSSRNFRNGGKRFGRVSEDDYNGNVRSAAIATLQNNFAIALETPLVGALANYSPLIPKSVLVTNPSPPPAEHYILSDLNPVLAVDYRWLTTQNSRKLS